VGVVQGSLFGPDGAPSGPEVAASRASGPSPDRTELGDGAWIEFRPQWMPGPDALFRRLVDRVPWRSERRRMYERTVDVPRLQAFYEPGDPLPDPALDEARHALAARYAGGPPLSTTGLCLYRNGRDSVAWHGDTIGRGVDADTLVAIVSLGDRRRFLLRPKEGGPSLRFMLGHGDLLVMGGRSQRTWEHAVPKTSRAVGPRISVQYRSAGVG
jgi:alkylated DNA repair dioxygenase AlkB